MEYKHKHPAEKIETKYTVRFDSSKKYKYRIVNKTKTHYIIRFDYFKNKYRDLKLKKVVKYTNIEGKKRVWNKIKILLKPQDDYLKQIFAIELLEDSGDKKNKQVRFGYYIIGKKRKVKGKWVWGQFCPIIPPFDLREIYNLMKKKSYI